MKHYTIRAAGTTGVARRRFSVDHCSPDGQFIAQEAFWFHSRADAEQRLAELVAQDAAAGIESKAIDAHPAK